MVQINGLCLCCLIGVVHVLLVGQSMFFLNFLERETEKGPLPIEFGSCQLEYRSTPQLLLDLTWHCCQNLRVGVPVFSSVLTTILITQNWCFFFDYVFWCFFFDSERFSDSTIEHRYTWPEQLLAEFWRGPWSCFRRVRSSWLFVWQNNIWYYWCCCWPVFSQVPHQLVPLIVISDAI